MSTTTEYRDKMMPESWYESLDVGIRFAVRVLHAHGLETCQSCQGGPDPERPERGHAYDRPTVDLPASGDDCAGFEALAALHAYGLEVRDVSLLWHVRNGLPYEKIWRITLWKTYEDRANDEPMFVKGWRAQ